MSTQFKYFFSCSLASWMVMLFVSLIIFQFTPVEAATAAESTGWNVQRSKNPLMRVLLGEAEAQNTFTAPKDFVIEDSSRTRLFEVPANGTATITYADGTYSATVNGETKTSSLSLRATPTKLSRRMIVSSYENRPTWNTDLNDNWFLGSVEVVYSSQSQRLLLVNELPLERYVRGIAEVSNDHPIEFLKTLLTAARTYAYYNILHPTKHAGEPYILDATDGDQVYRGASFTMRSPNVKNAQQATKKQVVTYNGEVIIAPYFSHSDGRTRAWSEVWNGDYAWSQSVDDPCCTGDTLLGHGVGLSGEGARYFADQGWDWQKILRYYYAGVEIVTGY